MQRFPRVSLAIAVGLFAVSRTLPAFSEAKAEKVREAKDLARPLTYPGATRFWEEYDGAGIYSARFTTRMRSPRSWPGTKKRSSSMVSKESA